MVLCSYKTKYWNYALQKEIEFECKNEKHLQFDNCIFHLDPFSHDLNHKLVEREFQNKIDEYFRKNNKEPFFCIGYVLQGFKLDNREFFDSVYFNKAIIKGPISINSIFHNHVSFNDANFSGKGNVSFNNSKFLNSDIDFFNTEFSNEGNVDFSNTEFSNEGNVDFSNSKFSGKGNVNFLRVTFSGKGSVSFFHTNFSNEGNVNFSNTEFSNEGNVNFSNTEFIKNCNVFFSNTKFSGKGDVFFSNTKFSGKGSVNFSNTNFLKTGNIYFVNVTFSKDGDVSFYNAKFLNHLSFSECKFSGKGNISFSNSQFSKKGNISFYKSRFSNEGHVTFYNSQFSNEGNVDFFGSQFSNQGNVDFFGSQFSNQGNASFYNSRFFNKGNITFYNSRLSKKGDVDFSKSWFSNEGYIDFSNSQFSKEGKVEFSYCIFSEITYFIDCKFESTTFFKHVTFKSPEEVKFETEDLSEVSFSNTDITRIVFGENTYFGKSIGKSNSESEEERFKIFDERRFEKYFDEKNSNEINKQDDYKIPEISLGSTLASYRNLRENYEYRLRYDEAGQFFIREMELKRKYRNQFSKKEKEYIPKKNGWFRRNFSFIGIYHFICKYGESSTLPLILFGIIVFSSTIYWILASTIDLNHKAILQNFCADDIYSCSLMRTFSDIVGFPEEGKIVDYITRIISIIVLATLFLPFRRKFERRFRH